MRAAERFRVVCPDNDYSIEMPTLERAELLLDSWRGEAPCEAPHHIEHDVWRDGSWESERVEEVPR